MTKHRWHKEIKAWADGAEIECRVFRVTCGGWTDWMQELIPIWDDEYLEFRIKPQPKEPQYLYVYKEYGQVNEFRTTKIEEPNGIEYIGKIKLEVDDDN